MKDHNKDKSESTNQTSFWRASNILLMLFSIMVLVGVGWMLKVLNDYHLLSIPVKLGGLYLLAVVLVGGSYLIRQLQIMRYILLSLGLGIGVLTTMAGVITYHVFNQYLGLGILSGLLLITFVLSLIHHSETILVYFSIITGCLSTFVMNPQLSFSATTIISSAVLLFILPLFVSFKKSYIWSPIFAYAALEYVFYMILKKETIFSSIVGIIIFLVIVSTEIILKVVKNEKVQWAWFVGNVMLALQLSLAYAINGTNWIPLTAMVVFLGLTVLTKKDQFRHDFYLLMSFLPIFFIFPDGVLNRAGLLLTVEIGVVFYLVITMWLRSKVLSWLLLLINFLLVFTIEITHVVSYSGQQIQTIGLVGFLASALVAWLCSRVWQAKNSSYYLLVGLIQTHILLLSSSVINHYGNRWQIVAALLPLLIFRLISAGKPLVLRNSTIKGVIQGYILLVQVFCMFSLWAVSYSTVWSISIVMGYLLVDFTIAWWQKVSLGVIADATFVALMGISPEAMIHRPVLTVIFISNVILLLLSILLYRRWQQTINSAVVKGYLCFSLFIIILDAYRITGNFELVSPLLLLELGVSIALRYWKLPLNRFGSIFSLTCLVVMYLITVGNVQHAGITKIIYNLIFLILMIIISRIVSRQWDVKYSHLKNYILLLFLVFIPLVTRSVYAMNYYLSDTVFLAILCSTVFFGMGLVLLWLGNRWDKMSVNIEAVVAVLLVILKISFWDLKDSSSLVRGATFVSVGLIGIIAILVLQLTTRKTVKK